MAKEKLLFWDLKSESVGLSNDEINQRRECVGKIHGLSSRSCSLFWQKSRMKWFREGDANTKFFHRCTQKRRKVNEILGLNFDGVFIEGVDPLKMEIKKYFENHFRSGGWDRPWI